MAVPAIDQAASPLNAWLVDALDRADCVVALRDYFRRLGFSATLVGPTLVRIDGDVGRAELEPLIESFATVMDVELALKSIATLRAADRPALAITAEKNGSPPRLGDLLTQKGFISEEELASALVDARGRGVLLGVALLQDGKIFEDELARTLSEQLAIPYVSIMRVGVDPKTVNLLPREVGEAVAAIPIRKRDALVQVAFADPTDPHALSQVRVHIPEIEPAVAELSDIQLAWRSFVRRYRS